MLNVKQKHCVNTNAHRETNLCSTTDLHLMDRVFYKDLARTKLVAHTTKTVLASNAASTTRTLFL